MGRSQKREWNVKRLLRAFGLHASKRARRAIFILKLFVICGFCIILFGSQGCTGPSSLASSSSSSAVRYVMFLDLTASIKPDQAARWVVEAEELLGCFRPGDGIVIYPIHAHSLDAAPLFIADTTVPSADAGVDELALSKRLVSKVRRDAKRALSEALSTRDRAMSTDIFGAIDRYRPDARGRRSIIIFFSDMLHSTRELDMERKQISAESVANLINAIAARHRWPHNYLGGATVCCILNSIEDGPQLVNDRRMLRLFWETLFTGLGARVNTFDTHFATKEIRYAFNASK